METIENGYVDFLVTQELFKFLQYYQNVEEEKFFKLFNCLFAKFKDEIFNRITTCFSNFKPYTYEHFIQHVFTNEVKTKDIDNYYKIQLSGLIHVIKKYNDIIKSFSEKKNVYTIDYFNGIINYFKYLIIETYVIIAEIELQKNIKPIRFMGCQNRIDSNESYLSAGNMLYNLYPDSSLSGFNASVFLIRQAIELKVKNCLGINVILDKDGRMIKMTSDKLIDFLYTNDNITLPYIPKSLLKKVHAWTQVFIHGGFVINLWQIDLALDVLKPLFSLGETKKVLSIHGAVVIKKAYYEGTFQNEVKEFLISSCGMEDTINVVFTTPEAIIE